MEADQEHGGEPPVQGPAPNAGSTSGGGKKGSPCEECGEQPWKYRCPGCSRLTCSLPCVQSHKRRTACTGKRPRTDPVPLSQFDDNQLLSDYNFLEETKQVRESAHRLIGGFGRNFGGVGGVQLPKWLFFLRKAAQRRVIWLHFLPRGMTRREQNRSRHNYRQDRIYWTLEWRFNSTDVVLTDHEIGEHTNLLSLLEKHLSPSPWKDQLTPYRNTELHDLKLFIQRSAKESESPYRQLNIEEPLGPQLRSIVIVEYPTINVFLPSDSCDFEVEKMVNKLTRNEKPPGSSTDSPCLEGTEFHEEEIEEGELTLETQVIDLKDCGTSHTTNLAPAKVSSDSQTDSKRDSSVLSYVSSLSLDDRQKELNQHSKMALDTTTGTPKTESCMKVYPWDTEEIRKSGLTSKKQVLDLKDHGISHSGNLAPAKGTVISKIDSKADSLVPSDSKADSLMPSSVSIMAFDGVSGPQEEHNQQSKLTPNSTPEALKRKSCMKVYPLDTEESQGLCSEVPNLEFEQEMRDAYEELFGDLNPDDFLNYDFELMNEDESVEMRSPFKLWEDLEEGEIPSA